MKNAFAISTAIRVLVLLWIAFQTPPTPNASTARRRSASPSKSKALYRYLTSKGVKSALSNPIFTLEHMREGVFLSRILPDGSIASSDKDRSYAHIYHNGNDPSSSFSSPRSAFFHAPPLMLALTDPILRWIPSERMQDLLCGLLLLLINLFTAVGLESLARNVLVSQTESTDGTAGKEMVEGDGMCEDTEMERELELEWKMDPSIRPGWAWIFGIPFPSLSDDSTSDEPREPILPLADIPHICAILYYCNPISILSNICGACSFHPLLHLLLVSSLSELTDVEKPKRRRSENDVPRAMFYLAVLAYVEVQSVLFLVPAVLFTNRRLGYGRLKRSIAGCIGNFLLWSLLLQYLSLILVGKSTFFSALCQSHSKEYNFVDLDVNIGLNWYFFVHMFDRFRRYFVVMHFGIPFLFAAPLVLRFWRYPMAITAMLVTIISLFKNTPTINDTILSFILLLLSPRTLARTNQRCVVCLAALPVTVVLYVVDYWTWLETGSGNANYVFFQCLAYNVFVAVILFEFVIATMRREKALRLTEKGPKKKKNKDMEVVEVVRKEGTVAE